MATFLLQRRKQKILDIYNYILQRLSTLLLLERNLYTCTASYGYSSVYYALLKADSQYYDAGVHALLRCVELVKKKITILNIGESLSDVN